MIFPFYLASREGPASLSIGSMRAYFRPNDDGPREPGKEMRLPSQSILKSSFHHQGSGAWNPPLVSKPGFSQPSSPLLLTMSPSHPHSSTRS